MDTLPVEDITPRLGQTSPAEEAVLYLLQAKETESLMVRKTTFEFFQLFVTFMLILSQSFSLLLARLSHFLSSPPSRPFKRRYH